MGTEVTTAALLQVLGYHAARKVLTVLPCGERERLALGAARYARGARTSMETTRRSAAHQVATIRLIGRVGLGRARDILGRHFDAAVVDRLVEQATSLLPLSTTPAITVVNDTIDEASSVDVARALAYLPVEHAADVLYRLMPRFPSIAMASDATGLLAELADVLIHHHPAIRDSMLDALAEDDPGLSTTLQLHMYGNIDLVELEYDELAAVLGGAPVEDIALALLSADRAFQRRCLDTLDPEREAQVCQRLESNAPVQISEMDAAVQRLSSMVDHFGVTKGAPTYA